MTHRHPTRCARPAGLATLELVLALPIFLMVMALMVDFGTRFCWKVRTQGIARHAVWGARWPRTGNTNPRPRPDYWPLSAGISYGDAADIPELDDPRVHQPVVRGPLPGGTVVNTRLLDPTRGVRFGAAKIKRGYPMLGSVMGSYNLHAETYFLDDKWQYQRMGLGSTEQRRIPVIYALAKASPAMVNAYVQTVVAIIGSPLRADLAPLDRDDEFRLWERSAPDFHPRLTRFCTLDLDKAKQNASDLIDHIQGKDERKHPVASVAQTMAQAFIGLYQRVIDRLRGPFAPNSPPPAIQAQIDQFQAKIDILEKFLKTLTKSNGG